MAPRGDAVQDKPTLEQEMEKFRGFTTEDGETVDSAADSKEEKAAQLQREEADKTAKAAVKAQPKDPVVVEDASVAAEAESVAEGEEKSEKPAKEAKPEKTAKERIAEITKARRSAERDLQSERNRNEDLERRLAALEGKPLPEKGKETKGDPDVEPKPSDYEYGEVDTKYIRALARFEARQEFKAAEEKTQKSRQSDAAAKEAKEFGEKKAALAEAGAAKYDDFDELVIEGATNGEWPLSDTIGKLMLGSEVGADIAYHLASNPKEARKLFSQTPLEQAAAFGRLEARFSSAEDAPKKPEIKVSKASPPIQGARGRSAATTVSPATTDFKAFEAQAMAAGRRQH